MGQQLLQILFLNHLYFRSQWHVVIGETNHPASMPSHMSIVDFKNTEWSQININLIPVNDSFSGIQQTMGTRRGYLLIPAIKVTLNWTAWRSASSKTRLTPDYNQHIGNQFSDPLSFTWSAMTAERFGLTCIYSTKSSITITADRVSNKSLGRALRDDEQF